MAGGEMQLIKLLGQGSFGVAALVCTVDCRGKPQLEVAKFNKVRRRP
jgi:hypothetical protein